MKDHILHLSSHHLVINKPKEIATNNLIVLIFVILGETWWSGIWCWKTAEEGNLE